MTDRSRVKTVTQVKSNQPCENKRQALSQIKRIDWSSLDFRTINQKSFYRTIGRNDVTFCVGPAGCGKTYLATHYALKNLSQCKYDNMVITKPLVEVDGEKMGYLPGDIDEKTAPYMMSLYYNMEQIIGKERLQVLLNEKVIRVVPLAYMRGLTFDNKMILLDETQNATPEQIKMFLTRIGTNSKIVVTGDLAQTDKHGTNGLDDSIRRFFNIGRVGLSRFTKDDIVRHPIIAKLLERYEDNFILPDTPAEMTISQYVHEHYKDYEEQNNFKPEYHN